MSPERDPRERGRDSERQERREEDLKEMQGRETKYTSRITRLSARRGTICKGEKAARGTETYESQDRKMNDDSSSQFSINQSDDYT